MCVLDSEPHKAFSPKNIALSSKTLMWSSCSSWDQCPPVRRSLVLSHEEDRPLLRSKSPTREHKSVIPHWVSRKIGPCLITSCKLSKTLGAAITGTGSELAPAQRSVVPAAVKLSSPWSEGGSKRLRSSKSDGLPFKLLPTASSDPGQLMSGNISQKTDLFACSRNGSHPITPKQKTSKFQKFVEQITPKVRQKMTTTPVQTGLQRLMRHTAKRQYWINSKTLVFTSLKSF